jgi:uncharacterized protein
MTSTIQEARPAGGAAAGARLPVIDTDVHPTIVLEDPRLADHLPPRWREYLRLIGIRNSGYERGIPTQRQFTHRLDAVDPSGRPTVLPDFTRRQLLDEFDMSGAVLSTGRAQPLVAGGRNFPEQLAFELARAFNDAQRDIWLRADPRFFGTINVPIEHPLEAVREIERVKGGEFGGRYAAVVLEPRTEYAIGNPKYWPVFEACQELGLPIEFHTSHGRRMTPSGGVNYYFEWHTGVALRNYPLASSLIFEGVFDRFPRLNFVLVEQSWAWAVPFSWRLDASWKLLRGEVPHLQRPPSEYFRDHFWFTTQPMEEPDRLEEYPALLEQFEDCFGPGHLMFSSDYPHWDFDSPRESVPASLPPDQRRRILGENASRLYHIPLLPGTGIPATP